MDFARSPDNEIRLGVLAKFTTRKITVENSLVEWQPSFNVYHVPSQCKVRLVTKNITGRTSGTQPINPTGSGHSTQTNNHLDLATAFQIILPAKGFS